MFKHILIPTDGSDLSRKAVLYGVELAKESKAKVTALTICEPYTITAVDTFTLVGTREELEMRAGRSRTARSSRPRWRAKPPG